MSKLATDILIVGGGAAGLSAALSASSNRDVSITVVDDNPHLGGQIWRAELGKTNSPEAVKLIAATSADRITILNNAQVFAAPTSSVLAAETPNDRLEITFKKLIIATGSRERFLPFPGWTLPGVFGAGGLQALVKGGMPIKGKRIVVAGSGPLLLAVADYLSTKGASILLIAEQTSAAKMRRFARGLWRVPSKMVEAAALRARLVGVPYKTDTWVTSASVSSPHVSMGSSPSLTVSFFRNGKRPSVECDYLACGFHLVPNTDLAEVLGCNIENNFVSVDDFQNTSIEHVYCAGELTGIAGVESSLVEGKIAGFTASGQLEAARELFPQRDRAKKFGESLNTAFALRPELKRLANDNTIICRCEDIKFGPLRQFADFRQAKLQTRCGMGPCQGRICGSATQFLFGWERPNVRPPIFPVKMENL